MLVMIEAEKNATSNKEKALKLYDEAALEFGRQSFYIYKALALERAGDIQEEYLLQAYRAYRLLGARIKLRAMETSHPHLYHKGAPRPEEPRLQQS